MLPWLQSWEVRHLIAIGVAFLCLIGVRVLARRVFAVDSAAFRTVWWAAIALTGGLVALAALDALDVVAPRTVIAAIEGAVNYRIVHLAGMDLTPASIGVFGLLAALSWWGAGLVRDAVERALAYRKIGDPGGRASVARLAQYVVTAVGLLVALQAVGIELGSLLAAGAVFAVGIGFAMQTIAQNFVSGVILLVERTISPGDVMMVDGQLVRIHTLGIRATIARTLDDEDLIIPNSFLVQANVKNLTLHDAVLRVRFPIAVVFGSDPERVIEVLAQAGRSVSGRTPREPVVLFRGVEASGMAFEVSVWIDEPWQVQQRRSELGRASWSALREAGIAVALPRVDLRLDAETRAALGGVLRDDPAGPADAPPGPLSPG